MHWNAAQAIAGIQLALGGNSPFFFGKELWRETRIPLFEQATDTRSEELRAQGVRPRVWFGERWITSIFDLFEENVRYFPALLPVLRGGGPGRGARAAATSRACRSCACTTARSTAGTGRSTTSCAAARTCAWRTACCPPARRSLDILANAAFYYGLIRVLATQDRPIWSQMSFPAAEENFHAGARDGIEANVFWPGVGEVPVTELVLRRLLPMAHEGLESWGVDAGRSRPAARHDRAALPEGRNGASWQAATFHKLYEDDQARPHGRAARDDGPLPRPDALQRAGPRLARRVGPRFTPSASPSSPASSASAAPPPRAPGARRRRWPPGGARARTRACRPRAR